MVMSHPFRKRAPHVRLAPRNHEIETLTSDGADQPLAEGVGLWRPHRRLDDRESHRHNRAINALRVNAVVIVHHESSVRRQFVELQLLAAYLAICSAHGFLLLRGEEAL